MSLPVKPWIQKLDPYVPGKPIEELERELGIPNAVKLASNENPLGPSPRAVEAIWNAAEKMNRYPDGGCFRLRHALATRVGVAPEQLVFGSGCSEILELLAKCFLGPSDEVVFAWPSFAMYPIVVQGMGATAVRVPLGEDFAHDLVRMREAITTRTRLVIVCNPNNPTGTSVGAAAFDKFVNTLPDSVVLVVDEAYVEYARRPDFPDALGWVRRRPGTCVLRTFSKIYGLAGLRIGYGIADREVAGYLQRARHPFNVDAIAEIAALAALDDHDHVTRARETNSAGVEFLTRELQRLGLETWPTDANFLLASARPDTYEKLLREGVIVRPMGGFGLPNHIRITIGTAEENERLVKALERVGGALA
jgi:histidinol-phosphate aminotransferase